MSEVSKYVVAIGDVFSGVTLIGPFDSFDEAEEWAYRIKEPWLISGLETPDA